ncbi:MAG: glycosyltransferase [Planctomycetota bacterium]
MTGIAPVDITVVVGTFNRAEMLRQTLASLTELETEGRFTYEIVVVDNASTDHTAQVIAETDLGAAAAVRGFYEDQAGVAFARNRGIQEAAGRWIGFQDDDQVAHPRWLIELVDLAARRDVRCVGGNVLLRLPEGTDRKLSPQCRSLLGEKFWMTVEQPYSRKNIPGTNNLLVRRDVLDEVGVFNTGLTDGGEDADLARRIRTAGVEAWYTPDSIVYHLIPEKRLSDQYMRWTATRKGQHVARREMHEFGRAMFVPVVAMRFCQAMLNYVPRYAAFGLLGDKERALGARCLISRTQGYLSQAWQLMRGASVDVAAGGESLSLREGREQLVSAE